MLLTVQIFQVIFYAIGILFMITLTILSIWGFIIFNKIYKNQRIHNFLLDKINQSISHISYPSNNNSNERFNVDEIVDETELFDDDENDNIISF